jgi:Cysteine-rich secretory protein family
MTHHKRARVYATAGLLVWAGVVCATGAAQRGDDARQILELTNGDRQEQGLQPLEWNPALAAAAQAHAERMAREGTLSHQYAGEAPLMQRAAEAGAHFEAIAENVAMAPDPEAVEQAWMHSTPHRTNILDPKMNALGIGVAERGGYLYAVEDFGEASQVLSTQQVEQSVQQMLRTMGIDPSLPAAQAEQACAQQHGVPPGPTPRLMVRFQTPDMQQLQAQLRQQVRAGIYTKAAVGACAPIGVQGAFTMYRAAVLLY